MSFNGINEKKSGVVLQSDDRNDFVPKKSSESDSESETKVDYFQPQKLSSVPPSFRHSKFKIYALISLITLIVLIVGFSALGTGLYSFLTHGVVNATLGQAGSIGLMAGGGGIALVGFLIPIMAYLKKSRKNYEELD